MSDRLKMVITLSEKLAKELKEAEKNAPDVKVKRALAVARADLEGNSKSFKGNNEAEIHDVIVASRLTALFASIWVLLGALNTNFLVEDLVKKLRDYSNYGFGRDLKSSLIITAVLLVIIPLTIFFTRLVFNSARDSIQLSTESGRIKMLNRLIGNALKKLEKFERGREIETSERETKEFRDLVR